uniref:TFIIB-type domain-containing protein n=1 Tax=viral metagenome TaxID=1070528 RepID=A0A6C0HUZ8_9ZZZZ
MDEQFLDMNDEDIDNLLFGINISGEKPKNDNICNSCKSENMVVDESQGYNVCMNCGVINNTYLNKNPIFSKEGDSGGNSSYGCPTNFFFPKSALGTKIKFKGYNRMSALQRQGQMPYKEKSLMEELLKIQEKCKQYNITQSIIDTSKILYKKVNDSKHTKGIRKGKNRIMRCINRRSMIAACVFYACKLQNEPRSPKEIADIYSLEIKHVNKGYRKFMDFINLEELQHNFTSSRSTDFIKRFADKLEMSEKYIKYSMDISNNINKLDLASTHEPPSVAAGCILLVVNMYSLPINKKQISEVFSISDVTISKTYRRIWPFHKIITNSEITDMILEKKQNMPKQKININKDNLIIIRNKNNIDIDTEESIDSLEINDMDDEEIIEKKPKSKKKSSKSNTITI